MKKFLAVLLSALVLAGLAGCGKKVTAVPGGTKVVTYGNARYATYGNAVFATGGNARG